MFFSCSLYHYRTTMCKFNRIGCQWRGPFHEVQVHEQIIAQIKSIVSIQSHLEVVFLT